MKLRWFDHVSRMEEGRLGKEILNWEAEGRRRSGRPRKEWMADVRVSIDGNGLRETDSENRTVLKENLEDCLGEENK